MTGKATPRPWKVGFKSKITDQTRIETVDGKCSLANAWGGSHNENAKLIVKCVNAHDELVEALNKVKEELEFINAPSKHGWDDLLIKVKQALAKLDPSPEDEIERLRRLN